MQSNYFVTKIYHCTGVKLTKVKWETSYKNKHFTLPVFAKIFEI